MESKQCNKPDSHLPHEWAHSGVDLVTGQGFWCSGLDPDDPERREYTLSLLIPNGITRQAEGLLWDVVKPALERFISKNVEYSGDGHEDLGPAAQIVDLNRKHKKLRRALWDKEDYSTWTEQPVEIAEDSIGHLILLLGLLRDAN